MPYVRSKERDNLNGHVSAVEMVQIVGKTMEWTSVPVAGVSIQHVLGSDLGLPIQDVLGNSLGIEDAVLTEGPQSRAQPSLMGISTTVTCGVSSK